MASEITLEVLTTDRIPSVVAIHQRAFPASALTALGPGALARYYHWLLTGPHDVHATVAVVDGESAGFLVGGHFRGALTGFLRRNVVFLAWRLVRRPRLWARGRIRERATQAIRLLRRRKAQPPGAAASAATPRFGVLAVAVDPAFQRRGVGAALLRDAMAEARARHASEVGLTVDPENAAAIRLYESLGWRRVGTPFTGSMRCPLPPVDGPGAP